MTLRKITPDGLTAILRSHERWTGDMGGERANLRDADLRDANLCNADLRDANLCNADLCGANLRNADLRNADLRDADLRGADLRNADLPGADLRNADLCGADLRWADLSETACCAAILGKYDVWITPSHTRIGCQYMDNDQWIRLTFDDAETMDKGAREWWSLYRDVVLSMIRSSQRQGLPVRENEVVS